MKTFVYLLVLLFILQIQSSLSQDWLSIKTIDHTFTNIPYELDSYTDASGNHLVLVDSGIKYYLVSYDGSIIRSTTLDNSGLHPVITGYGGKIFVLYNKSGTIYGKKSMNAGQSWSSITSITGSADNLYAVADVNGIHLVYANNQEYHLTYKRWDYSNEAWENTYQLTVPDLAENPYIDTSVSRLHVVHNKSGWTGGVNLQEKVNGSWQTMVNVEEEGERPVLATDSDYLHLFYYKSLGEKENNYEIYHTYRDLSGGDWSNDYQIEDVSYESEYRLEAVVTANNILHIIYSRKIYRSFTDETWSSEYTYGTDDSYHEQLSANGNDIYAIWVYEEGFNNYKLKLRQRDYDPLAPTNLAWTDTVNNHPKISWDYVECDIDEFDVYRAMGNQAPLTWSKIATTSNPYYVDTGITVSSGGQGPNYANYKVLARDYEDNESGFSDELQIQFMSPNGSESIKLTEITTGLLPGKLQLYENYPNPFNPTTTLSFYLPTDQNVSLTVYSLTGEKMVTLLNGFAEKGVHRVNWNGANRSGSSVSSGVYIYQLTAGDKKLVKKMLLAK